MKGKFEVGVFTLEDGKVSGPADYMTESGFAHLEKIKSGGSAVFNFGVTASPNIETALLVSLQTDYASWKGTKSFLASTGLVAS